MSLSQRLVSAVAGFGRTSPLPRLVSAVGGALLLIALARAAFTLRGGGSVLEALIDFLLVGVPGLTLVYTGFWMPQSDIDRRYYPRMMAWVLGGVVVMFGFIALRDLHPGVTVEWSFGTQAIALIIGSIGGLLIGIQDTRASVRTDQLEDRTQELAQRERVLERQNERLEEFATIVSHDLRNPLSVATGRLELVRADCDSEHLDRIADAHGRMDALIDDLLTLARQGEGIQRPEAVDLAALSERCWQHVATDGATLVVATDRTIRADRDRLQQLLENLVRNAVEHSSTSPRSKAREDSVEHSSTGSRAEPDDAVEHSSTSPRSKAREDRVEHGDEEVTVTIGDLEDGRGFYIEDDGPGIPEGERERVFESGYSTSTEGTGFGLAIVREIVDAHGWDVRVTDGSAGGARFEITGVEFEE